MIKSKWFDIERRNYNTITHNQKKNLLIEIVEIKMTALRDKGLFLKLL